MRKSKEFNERAMKTMSEKFAQLTMSKRERGTFPGQPKISPRGGSSYSFNQNFLTKLNVVISSWSCKEVDTHMDENDVSVSPSPSYLSSSKECFSYAVNIPPSNSHSPMEVKDPKEGESLDTIAFTPSKLPYFFSYGF